MLLVGLTNTRVSTDYAQKSPQTLIQITSALLGHDLDSMTRKRGLASYLRDPNSIIYSKSTQVDSHGKASKDLMFPSSLRRSHRVAFMRSSADHLLQTVEGQLSKHESIEFIAFAQLVRQRFWCTQPLVSLPRFKHPHHSQPSSSCPCTFLILLLKRSEIRSLTSKLVNP